MCNRMSTIILIILIIIFISTLYKPTKTENLNKAPNPSVSQVDVLNELASVQAKLTDLNLLITAKAQSLNVMQVWERDIMKKELRDLEDEYAKYKVRYNYLRSLV